MLDIAKLTPIVLLLLEGCLLTGCQSTPRNQEQIATYTQELQAKVAAAKELGLKADAEVTLGSGYAGFPNAIWNTGVEGRLHIGADPGEVTAKDMLNFSKYQLDSLLGKEVGPISGQPSELKEAVKQAIDELRRQPARPPGTNPGAPSPNPSLTEPNT